MKLIIVLACVLVASVAADDVAVVRKEQSVTADGYNYAYELNNGISAQESGQLKDPETIAAQGGFKFTSPEGETYDTQYVADENGFQPSGAHIPEIPILIQKALAYLATAKPLIEK